MDKEKCNCRRCLNDKLQRVDLFDNSSFTLCSKERVISDVEKYFGVSQAAKSLQAMSKFGYEMNRLKNAINSINNKQNNKPMSTKEQAIKAVEKAREELEKATKVLEELNEKYIELPLDIYDTGGGDLGINLDNERYFTSWKSRESWAIGANSVGIEKVPCVLVPIKKEDIKPGVDLIYLSTLEASEMVRFMRERLCIFEDNNRYRLIDDNGNILVLTESWDFYYKVTPKSEVE